MKSMSAQTLLMLVTVLFVVGTVVIASYVANLAVSGGLLAVDTRLAELAPWLQLIRYGIFAGVVGGWPWWTEAVVTKHRWSPGQTAFLEALRWRVPVWFLVYEAVLARDGLAQVFRLLPN